MDITRVVNLSVEVLANRQPGRPLSAELTERFRFKPGCLAKDKGLTAGKVAIALRDLKKLAFFIRLVG
jgi:hypothetical protein